MKHPLVAVGLVGAFVSVASLESFDLEELSETYPVHMPHIGRNMDDYKIYLREHNALLPERELRALRSYHNNETYTLSFDYPEKGTATFEYTQMNRFKLYIPDAPAFTLYEGDAYGFGERTSLCKKETFGFVCESSHVFGTLTSISFLQGDDPSSAYPSDLAKQSVYTHGLHAAYLTLKDMAKVPAQ